jgi:hypothetical protein
LISYGYLYFSAKKTFLLNWIVSLAMLLLAHLSRIALNAGHEYSVFQIINFASTILGYWLIFRGMHLFMEKKYSPVWNLCAGGMLLTYSLLTVIGASANAVLLLADVYTFCLSVKSGFLCLHASKPKGSLRLILAVIFFLWAAATLLYPFCVVQKILPAYIG